MDSSLWMHTTVFWFIYLFCEVSLRMSVVSSQMSGIRDLIPGSVIDATMFNPCGYSMNGMKTDVRRHLKLGVSLWDSCSVFCSVIEFGCLSRELTGRFTSPPNQSSPMSALKPTSPRRLMTSLSAKLWMSSNQGNLWQRFSSTRYIITRLISKYG